VPLEVVEAVGVGIWPQVVVRDELLSIVVDELWPRERLPHLLRRLLLLVLLLQRPHPHE
jgi:hypothetical protein